MCIFKLGFILLYDSSEVRPSPHLPDLGKGFPFSDLYGFEFTFAQRGGDGMIQAFTLLLRKAPFASLYFFSF